MSDEPRGALAERFRRLIRQTGPISLARYMGESNAHYYNTRDPLGASSREDAGDFITAPEVSQIFGELIGVRSEEHTSELQSLMRISYAVFCLKKQNKINEHTKETMNKDK